MMRPLRLLLSGALLCALCSGAQAELKADHETSRSGAEMWEDREHLIDGLRKLGRHDLAEELVKEQEAELDAAQDDLETMSLSATAVSTYVFGATRAVPAGSVGTATARCGIYYPVKLECLAPQVSCGSINMAYVTGCAVSSGGVSNGCTATLNNQCKLNGVTPLACAVRAQVRCATR